MLELTTCENKRICFSRASFLACLLYFQYKSQACFDQNNYFPWEMKERYRKASHAEKNKELKSERLETSVKDLMNGMQTNIAWIWYYITCTVPHNMVLLSVLVSGLPLENGYVFTEQISREGKNIGHQLRMYIAICICQHAFHFTHESFVRVEHSSSRVNYFEILTTEILMMREKNEKILLWHSSVQIE